MKEPAIAAYAAGLIDGEGSIHITVQKAGSKGSINPAYQPQVTVAMTDRQSIDFLFYYWGGKILNKKIHGLGKRPVFMWYLRHDEIITFLNDIKEYLLIKRPQADAVLEFIATKTRTKGSYTTSPEELALREGYYSVCKALNRREAVLSSK
jgi:hypothetical protein